MSTAPFAARHLGPRAIDTGKMLATIGVSDLEALVERTVPAAIRERAPLALPAPLSEPDVLARLRRLAAGNRVATSLIGLGYYGTVTPGVVQRNVLESPAWYTAYTPYQPEISQGRLEVLLNFQTMVAELTGMDMANASLLDEATASAEAMALAHRVAGSADRMVFAVDPDVFPQTLAVLITRAEPLGIDVVVTDAAGSLPEGTFASFVQYPAASGAVIDPRPAIEAIHARGGLAVVAADLLACAVLTPPGELGADVVVGSTQRFGVPMFYGGPHAAFLATSEAHRRQVPGRLVGVSVDTAGRRGLRLALQTREQHIRREKATSNICTAQVLLAVCAALYAMWHGAEGLQRIARRVHEQASRLATALRGGGVVLANEAWFDTLTAEVRGRADAVVAAALAEGVNLRRVDADRVALSLDETTNDEVLAAVARAFGVAAPGADAAIAPAWPGGLERVTSPLTHPVFERYHSETEMLRYLRRLADKDLALDRSMIPLGSCTMKLNATTEMAAVTWPEFADMHPFAPLDQAAGYHELIDELEHDLVEITGYDAVSFQPNAGSQGEYTGLLAIRAYHASRGDHDRDVCLIPHSAHGTNPASAHMAGLRVVVVACDDLGNVDLGDLRARLAEHGPRVAALMITYPSTHGVFEEAIGEICALVHDAGGQVYLDGANLNALVGVARPGRFGADVSHLNLHKTFCIPHGGGGPGVGPVAVRAHLAPFLPGHPVVDNGRSGRPVAAAPWGSAGILAISWAYVRLMGAAGLTAATQIAILNANYVAKRLEPHFPVLYTGAQGFVAHECIIDLRRITQDTGITAEDVAKRLADYGFHAPTLSFPVAGTLMIEPTESEGLEELDRFCEAMIAIRAEIDRVASGEWPGDDNPLHNAPHTAEDVTADVWTHPYSRQIAGYPVPSLRHAKYWPPVSRIDAAYGDRNVVCTCPPMDAYL